MELTKHAHAAVSLTEAGRTVVLDPGTLTPDAHDLMARAEAVLLTHDHVDHFDRDAVLAALAAHPQLVVHAPAGVAEQLPGHGSRVRAVAPGDAFDVAGLQVAVVGGEHAVIHADLPRTANVGYLLGGRVYDPGDAYAAPGVPVDTLLLPTSGPWTKTGEAVDFVRAVSPRRCVSFHDALLNDLGRHLAQTFLGEDGLTRVPLLVLDVGESVTL